MTMVAPEVVESEVGDDRPDIWHLVSWIDKRYTACGIRFPDDAPPAGYLPSEALECINCVHAQPGLSLQ